MLTEFFNPLQRTLSLAQAVPLVGPILVSPVKAVVSTAEIIIGLVKAVIFGTTFLSATLLGAERVVLWAKKQALTGFGDMIHGTYNLAYSCANMCTLGLFGAVQEHQWSESKACFAPIRAAV